MPTAQPIIDVLRRAYPLRFNPAIRPVYNRLVALLEGKYADYPDVLAALEQFLEDIRGDESRLLDELDAVEAGDEADITAAVDRLDETIDEVAPARKRKRTSEAEELDEITFEDAEERAEEGFFMADEPAESPPPAPAKPMPAAPPAPPPSQDILKPETGIAPPEPADIPDQLELDWLDDLAADVDTELLDTFPDLQDEEISDEAQSLDDFDAQKSIDAPEPEPMIPPGTTPLDREMDVRVVDEAHFSAYYPPQVARGPVYGLYVYTHTPEALRAIQRDVAQFQDRLGGTIPEPASAGKSALLAHGAVLTVVPEADGLTFDPPMQTRTWQGDWLRFEFDFTVSEGVPVGPIGIRASVQVAGIEIAAVICPTAVSESGTAYRSLNPLMDAKLRAASAQMYQHIFISYAREDTEVAASYRLAQQAAGHDVFMDSYSIRAGEDWQAALAQAIDEADIFQLFWSSHSAASNNVRNEWQYALQFRCPEDHCVGFIRPVYWRQPLITPPDELGHLNFKFVPLVADDEDQTLPIATQASIPAVNDDRLAALEDKIDALRADLEAELGDIQDAIRMLYVLVQGMQSDE